MYLFKNQKGELRIERVLIVSLIAVLLVWAITFIIINFYDNSGQIGDSFGMVNALFSALAFSLLIYTSLLQTQELRLQREELRENRKQLESSAKAHNELVELNKVIHSDRIIPQFKIESFEQTENEIHINLKTLFGDINFKRIHSVPQDDNKVGFSYGYKNGSLEGLKKEYSINGPMHFDKREIPGIKEVFIIYSTGTEKKYMQEIKNLTGRWVLDSPNELSDDSNISFE